MKKKVPERKIIYLYGRKGSVFLLNLCRFVNRFILESSKYLDILESKKYSYGKSTVSDAVCRY